MASILRNPNPYEWGNWNPGRRPTRAYIVVFRISNSEVVHLIESDVAPKKNSDAFYKKIEEKVGEIYAQYRSSEYDVLHASLPGIEELRAMLDPDDDFASITVEKILVQDQ
jgi:hypothetical protein